MKSPYFKFLLLTLLSGILLLSPYTSYQQMLAQGDHGRDLYCFQATAHGAMPYRDYWWVYGPLMPFYYAFFFKIFGFTIPSILIGKMLLEIVTGIFVFLSLSLLAPPFLAYIGALWFWVFRPDFFFTYNHAGGIMLMLAAFYCLLGYINRLDSKYLFKGLFAVFLLSLVKINFGLASLVILTAGVFVTDKTFKIRPDGPKKIFYGAALGLPVVVAFLYWIFLRGLPVYAIRQCLPYHTSDHPYNASMWQTIWFWWQAIALNINATWPDRFFAALILTLTAFTCREVLLKRFDRPARLKIILTGLALIFSYILNIHEYLASGVLYRTEWAKPFSILMIFFFLATALGKTRKSIRTLVALMLFLLLALRYEHQMNIVGFFSQRPYRLGLDRAQIYSQNDPAWRDTVIRTTRFLRETLKKDETFLALPYDPLYYYLTGKPAPTRQLIFFEHIKIPADQERRIIAELEQKNVAYVLISSRAESGEPGLGSFGETYCPLLAQYIADHYREIRRFGDWHNPPGWAWNHGTKILKKIETP